jgi:hypothetical protein
MGTLSVPFVVPEPVLVLTGTLDLAQVTAVLNEFIDESMRVLVADLLLPTPPQAAQETLRYVLDGQQRELLALSQPIRFGEIDTGAFRGRLDACTTANSLRALAVNRQLSGQEQTLRCSNKISIVRG